MHSSSSKLTEMFEEYGHQGHDVLRSFFGAVLIDDQTRASALRDVISILTHYMLSMVGIREPSADGLVNKYQVCIFAPRIRVVGTVLGLCDPAGT